MDEDEFNRQMTEIACGLLSAAANDPEGLLEAIRETWPEETAAADADEWPETLEGE